MGIGGHARTRPQMHLFSEDLNSSVCCVSVDMGYLYPTSPAIGSQQAESWPDFVCAVLLCMLENVICMC